MKRDDLSKGCDGWQVLDPTPQERSEGTFLIFNLIFFVTSLSYTYLTRHVLQDISHLIVFENGKMQVLLKSP